MKIGVLKEREKNEARVAITPNIAKLYIKDGFSVYLEQGAGDKAGFLDDEYKSVGVHISSVPLEVVGDADIILKVQPTPAKEDIGELRFAKSGSFIMGLLSPYQNHHLIEEYNAEGINSLALELLPRVTKAQSMDVLSSQSNLAGYRAVIEAAYRFNKAMPMFTTSAGSIKPAKVLILGAGVAGLQAIATARRLGAIVSAYDVRLASKEQVESLGAKFIGLKNDSSDKSGYAKELPKDFQEQQEKLLEEHVPHHDIIITTAQIPNKPAPKLISKHMIYNMHHGSVIVDLASLTGGNTECTIGDTINEVDGVKIIGYTNLLSQISYDASSLYSRNLYHLIKYAFDNEKLFKSEDDLIKPMLLTYNSKILWRKDV